MTRIVDAPRDGAWVTLTETPAPAGTTHLDGEVLASIVHLSDCHLCDPESPARLEYLEQFGMPGSPYRDVLGTIGTYRPHEIFTTQLFAAMIDAVNARPRSGRSGRAWDAAVITGDLTDNAQHNELDWYRAVLRGGDLTPHSGDASRSEWVGSPYARWSPAYWHPEGGARGDMFLDDHGYPRVPDLIDAARAPFATPGLAIPHHSVHGNHDGLLQGTVAADPDLRALAVSGERIVDLDPDDTPLVTLDAVPGLGPARYVHTARSPRERITPSPRRALLDHGDFARAVGRTHTYFAADVGPHVRLVALDTVNPHGGWEGSLDRAQLDWLRAQLASAGDRWIVVASHHPSWCLTNRWGGPAGEPRVGADEVLALLLPHPRVVAWMAGHVHSHGLIRHARPGGGDWLWEITAAAVVDWPQQGRTLEIVRAPDGEIRLHSATFDHSAPVPWRPGDLDGPLAIASIARTVARNHLRIRARGDRAPEGMDVHDAVLPTGRR
ncbi:MAG: metallophosphoesterase [Ilumatobacteraceae bacterium]